MLPDQKTLSVKLDDKITFDQNETTADIKQIDSLNHSLIYQHEYSFVRFKKYALVFFVLVIVINFFCNLALLIANCQPQETIEENYYLPFHMLDFYQSFIFAFIEACILFVTGAITTKSFKTLLVLLNVGGTLVALILFTFDPEFFESLSHWIEYSTQVLLTLTDFLFLFATKDPSSPFYKYRFYESVLIVISLILNILKLFYYGEVIPTKMGGERSAHFFEYSGEMFNDVFAFFFTLWNIQIVNEDVGYILFKGKEQVIELCKRN